MSPDAALRRAWMEAAYKAALLRREAGRLRTELTERIGPRSFPIGNLQLADGQTFPIHVESINAFHRLVRPLSPAEQAGMRGMAPTVQAAVIAAHDRARALLARLPLTRVA